MSRRKFVKGAAGAAVAAMMPGCLRASGDSSGPGKRPNILFVFTDQHRRQSLGFMGEDPVLTPHLDRLAARGLVFPNAVSNRPVCSPYRAMLLTGKYPPSNKVTGNCNSVWPQNYLRESERCVSDVLADGGYSLGFIGKWHLDHPRGPAGVHWSKGNWDAYTPPGPKRHSFGFWYSYGCMFSFMRPHFWAGDAAEDEKTVVDDWEPKHEADVAIEYIRNRGGKIRDAGKPFALFVAPHPPHPPVYPVPEKYLRHYEGISLDSLLNRPNLGKGASPEKGKKAIAQARRMVRGYFANVTGVDEQFGRIMKCLRDEGIERDTIVVFTSDHGEMLGSHSLFGKSVFYEESAGVPFIISWPGKIRAGTDPMPLSAPDLMPSLLGLAGLKREIPSQVEGEDHSALMLGKSVRRSEAALLFGGREARGLRTPTHTLMFTGEWKPESSRLFDLAKDPYQLRDVAGENRSYVKKLLAQAKKLARRYGAG